MKGAKLAGIFAAAGFVLSFISGLFSRGGVAHVIGMALIFALVFAALGAAIQWLTGGVLNVDGASYEGDAVDDGAVSEKAAKGASKIDIVVKDEELPSEDNSPRFFVGNNHQMLDASDYGAEAKPYDPLSPNNAVSNANPVSTTEHSGGDVNNLDTLAPESPLTSKPKTDNVTSVKPARQKVSDSGASIGAAESVFEPITLGTETVESVPSSTPSGGGGAVAPVKAAKNVEELEDELDEIPEFQGFATTEDDGLARNIDGEMIEDSDFSTAGAPIKKSRKSGAETQDAALMAKAISTVLAKDK